MTPNVKTLADVPGELRGTKINLRIEFASPQKRTSDLSMGGGRLINVAVSFSKLASPTAP